MHALKRAQQREFEAAKLERMFKKSHFLKHAKGGARLFKYQDVVFVTAVEKERYFVITVYRQ